MEGATEENAFFKRTKNYIEWTYWTSTQKILFLAEKNWWYQMQFARSKMSLYNQAKKGKEYIPKSVGYKLRIEIIIINFKWALASIVLPLHWWILEKKRR